MHKRKEPPHISDAWQRIAKGRNRVNRQRCRVERIRQEAAMQFAQKDYSANSSVPRHAAKGVAHQNALDVKLPWHSLQGAPQFPYLPDKIGVVLRHQTLSDAVALAGLVSGYTLRVLARNINCTGMQERIMPVQYINQRPLAGMNMPPSSMKKRIGSSPYIANAEYR